MSGIWNHFSKGINGCYGKNFGTHGLPLDWYTFGYMHGVLNSPFNTAVSEASRFCLEWDRGRVSLEGELLI